MELCCKILLLVCVSLTKLSNLAFSMFGSVLLESSLFVLIRIDQTFARISLRTLKSSSVRKKTGLMANQLQINTDVNPQYGIMCANVIPKASLQIIVLRLNSLI